MNTQQKLELKEALGKSHDIQLAAAHQAATKKIQEFIEKYPTRIVIDPAQMVAFDQAMLAIAGSPYYKIDNKTQSDLSQHAMNHLTHFCVYLLLGIAEIGDNAYPHLDFYLDALHNQAGARYEEQKSETLEYQITARTRRAAARKLALAKVGDPFQAITVPTSRLTLEVLNFLTDIKAN